MNLLPMSPVRLLPISPVHTPFKKGGLGRSVPFQKGEYFVRAGFTPARQASKPQNIEQGISNIEVNHS
jgi:hypothetical protein